MKKILIIAISVVYVMISGCVATTPYAGAKGPGSHRVLEYGDPTLPVDSGRIAAGNPGPYASAVAIGSIENPEARRDARKALEVVSFNQGYGYGGGGYRGCGGMMYCILVNKRLWPCKAIIDGKKIIVGPQDYAEIGLRPGKYNIRVYKDERKGWKLVKNGTMSVDYRRNDCRARLVAGDGMVCDSAFDL